MGDLGAIVYINDCGLLNATLMCQRLKIISKEAFSKKYNGASETNFYMLPDYIGEHISAK